MFISLQSVCRVLFLGFSVTLLYHWQYKCLYCYLNVYRVLLLYGFSPVILYLHKWVGSILILILALSVEMFIALYSIYMVSSNFILLDFQ